MLFSFFPLAPLTVANAEEPSLNEPSSAEPAAPSEAVPADPADPPEPAETTATSATTAPGETTATSATTATSETTAPSETTATSETTAPSETTATSETTAPSETTATSATTAPAETTATSTTTAPGATAAPGDDKAFSPLASDTVANVAATVYCYAAVDGEWKQVGALTVNQQYSFNKVRYFVYHTELTEIYGSFGYDADSYAGELIFPHTDSADTQNIWADTSAILNADTGEYRIPLSSRATNYLYYMPMNLPGSDIYFTSKASVTDQNVIDANNFYSFGPYDPSHIFGSGVLPQTRHIFHGETATLTLPLTEDVEWVPENTLTGEAVTLPAVYDTEAGTVTFTLENASLSVRILAKTDAVHVVYHAGASDSLTKLGQFAAPQQKITEDGTVRGETDYSDRLTLGDDGIYTVLGIDNDRVMVVLVGDANGRSLFYTFAGWRVGSGTSAQTFQPGDTLTKDELDKLTAQYAGETGVLEFTAVWEAHDTGGRLTSLNFYVNINCEIRDNMSSGFQPNPSYNYTPSVYSTRLFGSDILSGGIEDRLIIAPPTSEDTAYEVDLQLREATTVPISGLTIEALPSEETVLASIRASGKTISLDGVAIPTEQITSEHFKLRWYTLKYEHSDGWHVDGVLVAKEARLTVTKNFAGDDEAIAEIKENFYITIEHEEDGKTVLDYTLRLDADEDVTADGEAGYKTYDTESDTYLWSVPMRKGRTYTVTEHGNIPADELKWHYTSRVKVTNCPEAQDWTNATSASVTTDSYPNDLPDTAFQTVAFQNLYVQAGLLTVFKSDLSTGHGLRNVTFRISRVDGTPMQLWQKPGTNRYSSDTTAAEDGYTFLVPKNAATTDANGFFYVKLAVGEYYLDETLPLGYEGASRMRVSVTDDGTVDIAVAVVAGNNPPEGGWLDGVGTPILTVRNRSKMLTEVQAKKSWDNTAEEKQLPVSVELWRNGAKMVGDLYTQTLSAENDWTYTWYDLPLFIDGEYARYTLREASIGSTAHDPSVGASGYENYIVSYDAALYSEGTGSDYTTTAIWQDASGKWHYADHLYLTVHNSESTGIISLTKTDENGNTLPGARFTLYADAACTVEIETVESDDAGFVTFSPMFAGTYYMRETEVPYGYRTNYTLYKVVLRGGVATVTDADDAAATPLTRIVNKSIARLLVQKEDLSGGALKGATFRLFGDTVAGVTYTVDENGALTIPELPNGNYVLEEVVAPSGYKKLTEPIPFRVESGTILLESETASKFFDLEYVSGFTYRLTVRNEALFTIPSVGGTGIYPLTLIGTVLMCAAAAALLLARRFGRPEDGSSDAADADDADDADNPANSN